MLWIGQTWFVFSYRAPLLPPFYISKKPWCAGCSSCLSYSTLIEESHEREKLQEP